MKGILGIGAVYLLANLMAAAALADGTVPVPAEPGLNGVYLPWCALGYRSDSYGRGLEAGFTGANLRPRVNDEGCYQLGLDKAREVLAPGGDSDCRRDFQDGRENGFAAGVEMAGSECLNIGYSAGRAALDVGAREGNTGAVGARCVAEYGRGKRDALAHLVAEPELDNRDSACYLMGHFDGEMFP